MEPIPGPQPRLRFPLTASLREFGYAGLLLLVLIGFFMSQLGAPNAVLLPSSTSQVSDLLITFWPNLHYIQANIERYGELPLWRTLIFSGSPFDVDPQSGLWYPLNIVFLFLPATVGFNLSFGLHALVACVGMRKWAEATGASVPSAWLAGCAYALTPKALAHLGVGHVGLYYAAAWVPWAGWAVYQLVRVDHRYAGALGLALGMQLIAHPQLAFYTSAVAGTYGLALAAQRYREKRHLPGLIGRLGWLSSAMVCALLVASIQLLPLAKFAPVSARAGIALGDSAVSSLPWRYLWGLIFADHGGFMDYVLYVGFPVMVLAVVALGRRQAIFWWGFVGLALVFSLGINTPLYAILYKVIPVLAWLRAPSRIWFCAAAALALLSAWGRDRLLGLTKTHRRVWINLISLGLAGIGIGLGTGYIWLIGKPPLNLLVLGAAMALTAMMLGVTARVRRCQFLVNLGWFILVIGDLWIVDATYIAGRPFREVFARDELAAYLAEQQQDRLFRVYSPGYNLPRHLAAFYELETVDGVDPLFLERYDRFMELATGVQRHSYGVTVPPIVGGESVGLANKDAILSPALLGALNVRYIAAEFAIPNPALRVVNKFGDVYLYENAQFLPRAFLIGEVVPASDFQTALEWIQELDLTHTAVVLDGPALTGGANEGKVTWEWRSANRQHLRVAIDKPALLVISQTWYSGWRARVDGQPAPLWQIDGVLTGLHLQPGAHSVELFYQPTTLWWGVGLSIVGSMACLFWFIGGRSNAFQPFAEKEG
jgi:hypothetical protein